MTNFHFVEVHERDEDAVGRNGFADECRESTNLAEFAVRLWHESPFLTNRRWQHLEVRE